MADPKLPRKKTRVSPAWNKICNKTMESKKQRSNLRQLGEGQRRKDESNNYNNRQHKTPKIA